MSLVTFSGVENIGKQFYAQMANNYLKKKYSEPQIKKFSFPSFTTHRGQKVLEALKAFKSKDLDPDAITTYTKLRYRKLIETLLANYEEYDKYLYMHLFHKDNIAIVNNPYYSILAHGLAVRLEYTELVRTIGQQAPFLLENKTQTLSFFLTTPNLDKIIRVPEHLNHYKLVNNNYKQIFLTLAHGRSYKNIKPVFIEIDMKDASHITNTCNKIKETLDSWHWSSKHTA